MSKRHAIAAEPARELSSKLAPLVIRFEHFVDLARAKRVSRKWRFDRDEFQARRWPLPKTVLEFKALPGHSLKLYADYDARSWSRYTKSTDFLQELGMRGHTFPTQGALAGFDTDAPQAAFDVVPYTFNATPHLLGSEMIDRATISMQWPIGLPGMKALRQQLVRYGNIAVVVAISDSAMAALMLDEFKSELTQDSLADYVDRSSGVAWSQKPEYMSEDVLCEKRVGKSMKGDYTCDCGRYLHLHSVTAGDRRVPVVHLSGWTDKAAPSAALKSSVVAVARLVMDALAKKGSGPTVAIHCRAGVGRTGVVQLIGTLFARHGLTASIPDHAVVKTLVDLRFLRQMTVQKVEQLAFVRALLTERLA